MNVVGEIKVDMRPVNSIMKRLGVVPGGDVQRFHTKQVRDRIIKYMPYNSGAMIKTMIGASPIDGTFIHVPGPHAHYLWAGIVYVDPVYRCAGFKIGDQWYSRKGVKKVPSGRQINYTRTENPKAGPHWDRRLKAAEMGIMQRELQNYVKSRAKK